MFAEDLKMESTEELKIELKEEVKTETEEVIENEDLNNYEFLDVVLEEGQENVKKDNAKQTLMCDQCGYLAGHPTTLRIHKNSVHKGITHNCEHCDYIAATSSILNIHVGNMHLGIRYKCEDCDYKAGIKGN